MKKFVSMVMCGTLAASMLAGCGTSTAPVNSPTTGDAQVSDTTSTAAASQDAGKLVIYSPNTEDMVNTIIPLFEQETGIKVEIISAGSGELWKRIESEKENPYADVTWGGMRTVYANNLDLLEEYVSVNNADIPEEYQNVGGKITLYCLDGSNLLVNTDLIGDVKVTGYKDLLNPELEGKIIMGDPASSGSAFAHLTNMLLAVGGDYTSDEGWDYVEALLTHIGGKVANSSSVVHKGVADGEYTVALTYEDPSASYVRDGAPVEMVYMEEGVVYLASATGIIKNCQNPENAQKFIDFIISKQAQDIFGTQLTARPVRSDAELGDYWKPLDDINLIYEDYDYVSEHRNEILERYKEIFTRIAQ